MSDVGSQTKLFPDEKPRDDVVFINGRCVLRSEGDQRLLLVAGHPVAHFKVDDRMEEAHAMVFLVEQGYAQQTEVACAFGCDVRSMRRFQRRYEEDGMAALGWGPGYPKDRPCEFGGTCPVRRRSRKAPKRSRSPAIPIQRIGKWIGSSPISACSTTRRRSSAMARRCRGRACYSPFRTS